MKSLNRLLLAVTVAVSISSVVFAQNKEHDKHHEASGTSGT